VTPFQFYSEDMYQQVLARDHMVKALRNAAALDQLQLVFQPLVDLQTGQISGLEALLRCTTPSWALSRRPSLFHWPKNLV